MEYMFIHRVIIEAENDEDAMEKLADGLWFTSGKISQNLHNLDNWEIAEIDGVKPDLTE